MTFHIFHLVDASADQTEQNAVGKDAPRFAQNDDPDELFGIHFHDPGKIAQEIIREQRQQRCHKQEAVIGSACFDLFAPFMIGLVGEHHADDLDAVFLGKEIGDDRAGADADVIAEEAAEGAECHRSRRTAEVPRHDRNNDLECLKDRQHHRPRRAEALDVRLEVLHGAELLSQKQFEQQQAEEQNHDDRNCLDALIH